MFKNIYLQLFSPIALLSASLCALAQSYPAKPVRMVVGFAPGGSTDIVARLLSRKLTDSMGQSFIVENRAGASSNIAAQLVARAPADGLTLLYMTSTLAVNVSLFSNLAFDLNKDFAPVTPVVDIPSFLSVHGSLPVKSVKALIALAKSRPGEITYGSAGSGSATHLATELFKSIAGINIVHVPYKGSGPATTDFLGGHVQVLFVFNAEHVRSNAKTGRLRALAVTTRKRLSDFPALPTMIEAGVANYEASVWNGVLAPAGTPRDIVTRLNTQTAQAIRELTPALADIGAYPMSMSADEFSAFVQREIGKWATVVKLSGARAE
jgi:tripartite-type tricarboxylate transporter receptor subunit TctC